MKRRKRTKFCRTFGRALRVVLFILNAIPWTVGMLSILGATLVGFYSRTVKLTWAFDLYDLSLTTPCTVLFYYGVLLAVTTISGCFAGSGGRWWSTGLYCLLLIGLAIFDYVWGIRVFFKRSSLMDFLDSIAGTMLLYTNKDATFGIYPRSVKEYWDHIQQQNHCCGMFDWKDWKDTPIGKDRHLPFSCCNAKYGFPECGVDLGQHPDNADHQLSDLIHTKGCLKAYPRRYIWAFLEASTLGIILAIILLLDFILSLVLFFIVITCFYLPGKPITEPTVIQARRHSASRGHSGPRERRSSEPDHQGNRDKGRQRRGSQPHPSNFEPVTHGQPERQRVSIPPGKFEIEIQQEPRRDLEVII